MQTFYAYRYAAEGQAGESGDGRVVAQGTLAECRAAIRARLSLKRLRHARCWDGTGDDIEAWHDLPESAPGSSGCGGYAIRPTI